MGIDDAFLRTALGATGAGAALGVVAAAMAQWLGARPPGRALAVLAGIGLGLSVVLALPAASWPAGAVFGTLLLAIAWLDLHAGIVHAALAAPLALAGLGAAAVQGQEPFLAALAGCMLGYLVFVGLELGFRRLRGFDGLGRGDAWVAGAAGAWVGPAGLGPLVALAAAVTLVAVLWRDRRLAGDAAVPFAPALAGASWLVWLGGGGVAAWVAPWIGPVAP